MTQKHSTVEVLGCSGSIGIPGQGTTSFLIDTVGVERANPLKVYATLPTIRALQQHIFNEEIWPDFTKIPTTQNPVLEYVEIQPEQELILGERRISTVEVNHTVPAVGVFLITPTGGWCFSGDTHQTDRLFSLINQLKMVDYLFIEAAFPDQEKWLAYLARHLCPSLLFDELLKLNTSCEIWISHLKPREHERIQEELQQYSGSQPLRILSAGMIFNI